MRFGGTEPLPLGPRSEISSGVALGHLFSATGGAILSGSSGDGPLGRKLSLTAGANHPLVRSGYDVRQLRDEDAEQTMGAGTNLEPVVEDRMTLGLGEPLIYRCSRDRLVPANRQLGVPSDIPA